ncbi:MAG: choline dehydrogenase, partial [Tepidimonas taiwanensis]|nr:choline dehydrogenase [Tepidimonas taiwanensis]
DFIIVGAGSAGCVLANRLSADPSCRVLLLEAGGRDWNPLLRVPLMTGLLLRGGHANWGYVTEPEPNLQGRRLSWPRGKVIGGSSSINGMVHVRGLPSDYDAWAQQGLSGWSFADCLPAFKRIEAWEGGGDAWRGGDGPLPVTRPPQANPLFDAFIAAGRAAGHGVTHDFNGPAPEGFGRYDFAIRDGQRWSAARAYLDPARPRRNLGIVTRAHLLRVLFEKRRAVGVEALHRGRVLRLRAEREVILSAGTIGSPMALMHSGIGDADALRALGIPVVADRKEVGRNLQDHLLVRVEHACTQPITLHAVTRADRAVLALLRAMLFGTGPAASFPIAAGAYLKSDPALDIPDLQSFLLPGLSSAALRLPFLPRAAPRQHGHGFFANVYQMRPESRGTLSLRSADPRDPPLIRPNHLSAPRDLAVLREGVKRIREVFAQKPMDPFRGPELSPGPGVRTDSEIEAFIRRTAESVFHCTGTCRMGADEASVVDARLRVRGVKGLRIADASVMPAIPSTNTAAPT